MSFLNILREGWHLFWDCESEITSFIGFLFSFLFINAISFYIDILKIDNYVFINSIKKYI